MTAWFKKNCGDAMLATEQLEEITARFQPAFEQAGRPRDMAIFLRHESEGRLHCEAIAYFSPAAAEVARAVDATPCSLPSPDSLGLLVGSGECRAIFFPESR